MESSSADGNVKKAKQNQRSHEDIFIPFHEKMHPSPQQEGGSMGTGYVHVQTVLLQLFWPRKLLPVTEEDMKTTYKEKVKNEHIRDRYLKTFISLYQLEQYRLLEPLHRVLQEAMMPDLQKKNKKNITDYYKVFVTEIKNAVRDIVNEARIFEFYDFVETLRKYRLVKKSRADPKLISVVKNPSIFSPLDLNEEEKMTGGPLFTRDKNWIKDFRRDKIRGDFISPVRNMLNPFHPTRENSLSNQIETYSQRYLDKEFEFLQNKGNKVDAVKLLVMVRLLCYVLDEVDIRYLRSSAEYSVNNFVQKQILSELKRCIFKKLVSPQEPELSPLSEFTKNKLLTMSKQEPERTRLIEFMIDLHLNEFEERIRKVMNHRKKKNEGNE